MRLKGIIDYDCTNYKKPCLTLEFPYCSFKCDKLNGCRVCQNSELALEPDIEVSGEAIWKMYKDNPLTKAFCLQGLEPFDSYLDLIEFIQFIRLYKKCDDPIIIYTGYERGEDPIVENDIRKYHNIIIKWGPYINNNTSYYNQMLGVRLASDNQWSEFIQ